MTTDATLADLALDLLVVGVDEPYGFAAAGLAKLQAALDGQLGRRDLRERVTELVCFARFLAEERGCPKAGRALVEIAATATEAIRRASAPESLERMRHRAGSFAQFRGDAAPRTRAWGAVVPSKEIQALRAASLARRIAG